MTSPSAWSSALSAGRSTTGRAGRSLRRPGGGSDSDRLTRPKPEDRRTAAAAGEGQNKEGRLVVGMLVMTYI